MLPTDVEVAAPARYIRGTVAGCDVTGLDAAHGAGDLGVEVGGAGGQGQAMVEVPGAFQFGTAGAGIGIERIGGEGCRVVAQ
ncbi:hypothetical protein D3C84_1107430 [compost metagenome]